MDNIKGLGNKQLGLKYEITEKKLNNIKMEIIDEIKDILGTGISKDIYEDSKRFKQHIEIYGETIPKENKDIFSILSKEQEEIQKEIEIRQKKMLAEIGIQQPSIWVKMIAEHMQGENFPLFDDMIKYIKLKKQQLNKRPKNKKIMAPQNLINVFEQKIHIPILTILEENLGPTIN